MFYAKSLYQGGLLVCADELIGNKKYEAYKEKGIVCLECSQEVHLKSGVKKQSHFAHFRIDDLSLTESGCSLRMTGRNEGWSYLTPEGKKQRRELFQKYFLSIIKRSHLDFDENIQQIEKLILPQKIFSIKKCCSQWLYKNKQQLIDECRALPMKKYDGELILRTLIASEAIEYIATPSSQEILERLISYSIFKCRLTDSNFDLEIQIDWNQISKIFQEIKHIFLSVNWIADFSDLINNIAFQVNTRIKTSDDTVVGLKDYFYLEGSPSRFNFDRFFFNLQLRNNSVTLIDATNRKPVAVFAKIISCSMDAGEEKINVVWEYIESQNKEIFFRYKFLGGLKEISNVLENFFRSRIREGVKAKFILNQSLTLSGWEKEFEEEKTRNIERERQNLQRKKVEEQSIKNNSSTKIKFNKEMRKTIKKRKQEIRKNRKKRFSGNPQPW